ncbi:hypothetical protein PAXINDRAFT_164631 [Paxillus involutus ATCC 200175]|uniref:Alpha-type protein kinase domain-containing protein n=1 Tax=Paxillus involutus ATCC 200175 TaxID=664439 RepID=A0A0C9T7A9_PAXIN|nr:hypothetical protein PAXINDRAFT_164631 [Paxillus involutus ATCC 200175]
MTSAKASASTRKSKRKLESAIDYAIFQCKPISSFEASNEEDLIQELRLLHFASYFLQSFYERAKLHRNVNGTFVGKVTSNIPPRPADHSTDDHTLVFKTFLAAPLLSCDGLYEEQKFCGNTDIPENEDPLGLAIDAYIHHALLDSGTTVLLSDLQGIIAPNGSIKLFDPQAHTINKSSGHWDKGASQIRIYLKEHCCNSVCRALRLHLDDRDNSTTKDNQTSKTVVSKSTQKHPLRVGFD